MTPEELLAHSEFIQSLARSLVSDEHLAEDIAQDIHVAAWKHPPSAEKPIRAWLSKVTRNCIRKLYRGDKSRTERESLYSRSMKISPPEDIVAREEVRRLITDAVLELNEPYQSAILLRFYEGLPPREISKYLAIPIDTVKKRLHRALAQLHQKLDAQHGGDRRKWLMAIAPIAGVKVGGTIVTVSNLCSFIYGVLTMFGKVKPGTAAFIVLSVSFPLVLLFSTLSIYWLVDVDSPSPKDMVGSGSVPAEMDGPRDVIGVGASPGLIRTGQSEKDVIAVMGMGAPKKTTPGKKVKEIEVVPGQILSLSGEEEVIGVMGGPFPIVTSPGNKVKEIEALPGQILTATEQKDVIGIGAAPGKIHSMSAKKVVQKNK